MNALLLTTSDSVREQLGAALKAAGHHPDIYGDLAAARRAGTHVPMIFVEHPGFTHHGNGLDASTLAPRSEYVLVAILSPDAGADAIASTPALDPDFIIDRLDSPTLEAQLTLIERRARSLSAAPPPSAPETDDRTWFNAFVGRSEDPVYVIDAEGAILDVNPAACHAHSRERSALRGRTLKSVGSLPDDLSIPDALRDGGSLPIEVKWPLQGESRSMTLSALPTRYDDQQATLIHLCPSGSAELGSSFADRVVDRVSAYGVVTDAQGQIRQLNANCEQQLDQAASIRGRSFGDVFFEDGVAADVDAALADLRAGDAPERHGTWWIAADSDGHRIAWADTLMPPPNASLLHAAPADLASGDLTSAAETLPMLSKALEKVSDAVLVADARQPDLPTVYSNPAFESMTGYSRSEVIGRNCRFLQGPDSDPVARAELRTALEKGTSCHTTIKNYRKDGTPFWNEITIFPVRDTSGTVTHFLGILHDITEQRARRHQIEQGEQYLRRIVDALPQLIFLKNEAGEYLLANETAASVYGTTPDQMEGATDADFAAAARDRDFRADDRAVIRSNQPREFVETIEDAAGQEHIVKTELLPFESIHADERLLLGISTDITEQVRTEEALRQERDLLDNIMSTSVAAIAVIDTAGRFVFANERAEDLLELTPHPDGYPYELPTWRLTALDGGSLSEATHPFQKVMRTGEPVFGAERAVEWPDGHRRLLSINAAPLTDDSGNVVRVVTSIEDITERKEAERALQVSEERWRRLIRHHPEPILISSDSIIKYINPAGARVFGADSPEAMIGESILEFIDPSVHEVIHDRIETIEAGGQTEPLEHRLLRPDGEERIVQAFSVPITYDGAPAAQTVVRDITAQKAAERALRTREQQQVALAELGLYALEESDLQALMKEVADRLADTLDVAYAMVLELKANSDSIRLKARSSTATGQLPSATSPLDSFALARHALERDRAIRFGPHADHTGADVPFADDACCGIGISIPGRDQPYGLLCICTLEERTFTKDDVNFLQTVAILISNAVERKRTEVELLLSEKRYRTVVEQQTELICRLTPDGRLTFVNHAVETFVGTSAETLIGQPFDALLTADDPDAFQSIRSDFSPEQPVHKYEFRLRDADGEEHWLQWAFRAFFDPNGNVAEFQASGRDVTERKQLEREILEVSTRERRRIGQDLHDGLGSHLSGVTMLCRGVIRKTEAGEPVDKSVIEEIAQLVQESIRQVRKLARGLNPVKMENEGLPSALQELVSSTQTHPDISCSFSSDADLPDPDSETALQLYRIAQEAINNALKHADANHIDVRLGTKDDTLLLTVTDDGIGISSPSETASGMGLRVMKYRANTIGAQLRIRPREDSGTLVQCALPLSKLHSPPRPQSTP